MLCECAGVRCAHAHAWLFVYRIKLLEAIDHTDMEEAENDQLSKKKKKGKRRKKKAPQEAPPAETETEGEEEAGQVEKKVLMARTENIIHDPFEQTKEVKVGTYTHQWEGVADACYFHQCNHCCTMCCHLRPATFGPCTKSWELPTYYQFTPEALALYMFGDMVAICAPCPTVSSKWVRCAIQSTTVLSQCRLQHLQWHKLFVRLCLRAVMYVCT